MKRILALTFCLGLALTPAVHADNKEKKHAKKAEAAAHHNAAKAVKQNASYRRSVQHNAKVSRSVQTHQNAQARHFQHQQAKIHQAKVTNNATRVHGQNAANGHGQHWNHANHHNNVVANHNNHVVKHEHRNVTVRNRNSWHEASRRFNWHEHHDHAWWRHHYGHTRFVLFGGGYYFWNAGYWYPAYGYNPAYSTYVYDEPIYGYNNYAPGQVITNAQIELQRQGYYDGEIDGLIGPNTRHALARYQEDHGLIVTRAIDEPTLEALGLA